MVCLTLFLYRPFSAHQIYSLAYLIEFPCLSIPFLLAGLSREIASLLIAVFQVIQLPLNASNVVIHFVFEQLIEDVFLDFGCGEYRNDNSRPCLNVLLLLLSVECDSSLG